MKNKIKEIVEEHRTTLPRALIEGLIITIIGYGGGVLLVDVAGLKYYIAGLMLIPITFTTKYIINKYWVYKK